MQKVRDCLICKDLSQAWRKEYWTRTENWSYSLLKELCASVCVYACVCAHTSVCVMMCVWWEVLVRGELLGLILSFYHVDGTQVVRPAGKCPYSLSHLAFLTITNPSLLVPEIRLRALSRLGNCPVIELHCQQHCFPANWKTLTIILIADHLFPNFEGIMSG